MREINRDLLGRIVISYRVIGIRIRVLYQLTEDENNCVNICIKRLRDSSGLFASFYEKNRIYPGCGVAVQQSTNVVGYIPPLRKRGNWSRDPNPGFSLLKLIKSMFFAI